MKSILFVILLFGIAAPIAFSLVVLSPIWSTYLVFRFCFYLVEGE